MTKPPEFGAYMNNVYKFSHWVQLAKWYCFDGSSLDFSGFGDCCPIGATNSHLTGSSQAPHCTHKTSLCPQCDLVSGCGLFSVPFLEITPSAAVTITSFSCAGLAVSSGSDVGCPLTCCIGQSLPVARLCVLKMDMCCVSSDPRVCYSEKRTLLRPLLKSPCWGLLVAVERSRENGGS